MAQIRWLRCGSVNCYLVLQGENAVLVDTGREAYRQMVYEACRACGVRLLVLTHGHVDHVQNAAFLAEALRIPVAMGRADLPLLADGLAQPLSARGTLGRLLLAASVRSLRRDPVPPFVPDLLLEDGDSLERWGIPARVLSLPGHTLGSLGLDVDGRYLLAGDALMHMGAAAPARIYHDRARMLESAGRIGRLGDRQICFGHGRPAANRAWA